MSGEIFEGSVGDATSHMSSNMTGRISVIARVSGRRRWTLEQKLGMLRDAFGSGDGVRTAIERHEVSNGHNMPLNIMAASGRLTKSAMTDMTNINPTAPAITHNAIFSRLKIIMRTVSVWRNRAVSNLALSGLNSDARLPSTDHS